MCAVCFNGNDPVVRESLNAGIGVLMGVTSIVLGCFARFFLVLAKRARAAENQTWSDFSKIEKSDQVSI
jgi:hypothetical protein